MAAFQYRPAIDGLRAVAVLSVFVFHLNHRWLPGGFVGVDVFFVISGYLITSIILNDCENGEFCLLKFYQRRIARIFPAFFTVAFATLLGASLIYSPQDYASAGANLVAAALSVANMKFMLQGNYFEISPDAQPFLHYWSLSVEEQFYLFYPLLFLLLFKYARNHLVLVLSILGFGSLIACLALTPAKPVWAFYLLPTRAWELCAGSLLAVTSMHSATSMSASRQVWLSVLGLLLIFLSFVFIDQGAHFPGWQAILPVSGTIAILLTSSAAGHGWVEKLLSAPPLTGIGRMSYSLYLWHWPVFSLIDYQMFFSPEPLRLGLKVGLSFLLAYLSYLFIENPSRSFLNHRKRRVITFASLAAALAVSIPLGISIRRNNYVNAEVADVARGGLVFPGKLGAPAVVLMGDSNGSMYGKVMKEICSDLGYKLTVISVAGADPLSPTDDQEYCLWESSLAVIEKEKPEILVLACRWESKLEKNENSLPLALGLLRPLVGRLVILNQPPLLPADANRAAIRGGKRPPFIEDPAVSSKRRSANNFLNAYSGGGITILDIASHFQGENDDALFLDTEGHQLYHDSSHLSGFGAERIRSILKKSLSGKL